ncbi:MAG TPA: ATP synthase F1 subunit gamma [Vitreimonas sp.]|nr:ATP synthase F1 subunit gamma [Vitreimonas sp.]
MANTRQIKRRITASQNISKITKAMEMVAASKMRRAQEQATATRPYSRALQASLSKLGQFSDSSLHPLLAHHETGANAILLLSTDKGLCGSLNPTLFKATLQAYRQFEQPKLIAVGKKAIAFARIFGLELHAQFSNVPERLTNADTIAISTLIMDGFLSHEFKTVHIVYMDFINTLSQKVRLVQLLPLTQDVQADEALVSPELKAEYAFEPSPREILSQLLPYYLENSVYQAFLEGKASEHSARMVAMKNASENAAELVSELKLEFNKSRQASITNELLDITVAAMTLKK